LSVDLSALIYFFFLPLFTNPLLKPMNKKTLILTVSIFSRFYLNAQSLNGPVPPKTNLSFTENKGQFSDQFYHSRPDVLFGGNDGQMGFYIKNKGISYQLYNTDKFTETEDLFTKQKIRDVEQQTIYRIDINWLNTNLNAFFSTGEVRPGYDSYYLEQCPKGAVNAHSYKDITVNNIYSNINLHYYEKDGHLKYDYLIAPNADYTQIKLEIKGAKISVQKDGGLLLITPLGNVLEHAPIVCQNGKLLKARYLVNNNVVSFIIENYNPNEASVIDPATRIWGTYYGGTGDEIGFSSSVDASHNVYLSGYANSNNSIATTGAHQTVFNGGNWDAFLVKFDGNGVRQWGTYYGGMGKEIGFSCTTDSSGNIFMTGYTDSNSGTVIATPGSYQTAYGGGAWDGFLVKFNNTGVRQWATYVGGSGEDRGYSCSTDPSGNVYMSGISESTTAIASLASHQANHGGGIYDACLVKFNSSGTYQWGTYYGGTGSDVGNSCCTDISGNVFLSGTTTSSANSTAIASPGSHQTNYGGWTEDAFLVKFNASGIRQWGTFYGGNYGDNGASCAADASGNIYLTGITDSQNGTTIATPGSHQLLPPLSSSGPTNAYLVKFNGAGTRLWGTYYGGTNDDHTRSCRVDASDNVYIAGFTASTNSIASNGHQNTYGGGMWDAFLAKFNGAGVRQWATYYGGSGVDVGYGCSAGHAGEVYMVGYTASMTGTTIATLGSHQPVYNGIAGMNEAYLVKFACPVLGPTITANNSLCVGASLNFTAMVNNSNAVNYEWNGPHNFTSASLSPVLTNVDASNSGTYTLSVNDGLGCSEFAVISVSVNALPTILAGTSNSLLCSGQSAVLTASGASTYLWSSNEVNAAITVSPAATAIYTVTGTDINGCSNTTLISQNVNDCTSLKSYSQKTSGGVQLYPNPNTGNFWIEVSDLSDIVIVNALGQPIYKNIVSAGVNHISIKNKVAGVYFITLLSNNTSTILKIIVQ
jgi:hypothetical protein